MSVIPVDEMPHTQFWRRLAGALDAYFVNRTRRAVPEVTLRRSKQEIARCRRLMHQHATVQAAAAVSNVSRRAS